MATSDTFAYSPEQASALRALAIVASHHELSPDTADAGVPFPDLLRECVDQRFVLGLAGREATAVGQLRPGNNDRAVPYGALDPVTIGRLPAILASSLLHMLGIPLRGRVVLTANAEIVSGNVRFATLGRLGRVPERLAKHLGPHRYSAVGEDKGRFNLVATPVLLFRPDGHDLYLPIAFIQFPAACASVWSIDEAATREAAQMGRDPFRAPLVTTVQDLLSAADVRCRELERHKLGKLFDIHTIAFGRLNLEAGVGQRTAEGLIQTSGSLPGLIDFGNCWQEQPSSGLRSVLIVGQPPPTEESRDFPVHGTRTMTEARGVWLPLHSVFTATGDGRLADRYRVSQDLVAKGFTTARLPVPRGTRTEFYAKQIAIGDGVDRASSRRAVAVTRQRDHGGFSNWIAEGFDRIDHELIAEVEAAARYLDQPIYGSAIEVLAHHGFQVNRAQPWPRRECESAISLIAAIVDIFAAICKTR